MSVEHVTGNLLDFPAGITVIAHCCSCQNRFGSGIALAIKAEYPAAFEADTEAFTEAKEKGNDLLGTFSAAEVAGGKRVANLYGQTFYGTDRRQVDYEGFYVALERLRATLLKAHSEGRTWVLGLPYKIASDRAGGDWKVVEAMIRSVFEDCPIRCVIVQLPVKPQPVTEETDE